ncbi:MAG: D-amino acid dehydrogenase [Pseudomonadota bacterium]
MNIAIIGAGIIGITTAWELACDGHQVTVLERRGAAAEETSFANAGVVAPGYVTPWASPGMPKKVLSHLFRAHSPVRIGWPLSAADLRWAWAWFRACTPDAYQLNRARLQQLAFYSRERLRNLTSNLQLEYDRSEGYMVLLRSEQDRALVEPGLEVLRQADVAFKELDAAQARAVEPALNPELDFCGAIHLPDDEVANCRQFALLLKSEAQSAGVRFEFNTPVRHLNRQRPASLLVDGEASERSYDAVVLCAGTASAQLLDAVGMRLALAPVYGYSLTAALREPLAAPRSALMDERYKVAISRLGNRIRVAGGAELGGTLQSQRASSIATLYKVLQDWFPSAAQLANPQMRVQVWKGARPMLPDGPPIIGGSGLPGLWLNLGHGSSGWALSCGSARLLADLMRGAEPALDAEGFRVDRLAA